MTLVKSKQHLEIHPQHKTIEICHGTIGIIENVRFVCVEDSVADVEIQFRMKQFVLALDGGHRGDEAGHEGAVLDRVRIRGVSEVDPDMEKIRNPPHHPNPRDGAMHVDIELAPGRGHAAPVHFKFFPQQRDVKILGKLEREEEQIAVSGKAAVHISIDIKSKSEPEPFALLGRFLGIRSENTEEHETHHQDRESDAFQRPSSHRDFSFDDQVVPFMNALTIFIQFKAASIYY